MHFSGIFSGIYLVYYSQIMIIWNVTKINYRLSNPLGIWTAAMILHLLMKKLPQL